MVKKFPLGLVLLTSGVNEVVAENLTFAQFVTDCLSRHGECDWGDLSEEDIKSNFEALAGGSKLFSAYESDDQPKIWIITEANRCSTTILFPDEY